MAAHKLNLTYDETTGELAVTHRCTVEVAGHKVSHAEAIELDNAPEVVAALKGWLDSNRKAMGEAAALLAVRHVAAVTAKEEPGVKRVKVGGSLGASSEIKVQKK